MSSRNGDVIPEWKFPKDFSEPPRDGAELYKVVGGKEKLVGIYVRDSQDDIGRFKRVGE